MDSRAARRMATRRLAQAARQLCADMMVHGTNLHGLSDADTARMVRSYTALAYELDVRVGDVRREPRSEAVDPLQEVLFEAGKPGGGEHGQEAEARPEVR